MDHPDRPPDIRDIVYALTHAEGDIRAGLWETVCHRWRPENLQLLPLLESHLSQVGLEEASLRRQLVKSAFSIMRVDTAVVRLLARIAQSASTQQRLALICDVMSLARDPGAPSQCAILLAQTFPAPQDELGLALCKVSRALKARYGLSAHARELLITLVSNPPQSIAGPLAHLAAAAGINRPYLAFDCGNIVRS
jgi:hypothetical protein